MKFLVYDDDGPDKLGRRRFSLLWFDFDGEYREQLYTDGRPVGLRRGQCYHTQPERFLPTHAVASLEAAERALANAQEEYDRDTVRFFL